MENQTGNIEHKQSDSHSITEKNETTSLSYKTRSRASSSTKSVSYLIAIKRAEAEAARTKVRFAHRERDLQTEAAQATAQAAQATAQATAHAQKLEADLQYLKQEKEAAVAEAELQALLVNEDTSDSQKIDLPLPVEKSIDRVSHFVQNLSPTMSIEEIEPRLIPPVKIQNTYGPDDIEPELVSSRSVIGYRLQHTPNAHISTTHEPFPRQHNEPAFVEPIDAFFTAKSGTDGNANAKIPDSSVTSDLTKFLLKKELLLSRFTTFNDRAETYAIWKAGFQNITTELQVSEIEELDLLVKWLGPDSSRHALSLRSSNVNNPTRGLQRIWERLEDRYGCPEMVESALKSKLSNFPQLGSRDTEKLYELADILSEIESTMENEKYRPLFSYFNTSSGVSPIVSKLPTGLQEKWTGEAVKFKRRHQVSFPPFWYFAQFIRELSRVKNDPSFNYKQSTNTNTNVTNKDKVFSKPATQKSYIATKKTEVNTDMTDTHQKKRPPRCPLHHSLHSLNECVGFRFKPLEERKHFLRKNKICQRCCNGSDHTPPDCKEQLKCSICENSQHATALHEDSKANLPLTSPGNTPALSNHGGEKPSMPSVQSKCTEICGKQFSGKSCAKVVLAKIRHKDQPNVSITGYVIIDDQSNGTLGRTIVFDTLNIESEHTTYNLSSCAGLTQMSARTATGCIIESIDGTTQFPLPRIIECDTIPEVREEIPTPEVALQFPHLSDLASSIPTLNEAGVILLIGRDVLEAHYVYDQRIGPKNTSYAQRLSLGWVIIGDVCLGNVHKPDFITVNKIHSFGFERSTIFKPCDNTLNIKPSHNTDSEFDSDKIGSSVFQLTDDDEKIGMSVEDKEFLKLMESDFCKNENGNWSAPLPFRNQRPTLPNNYKQAAQRAKSLDYSLKRNQLKRDHFSDFMKKIFENGHAEPAPPLSPDEECWYLPIFGVYHPRKRDQIRAVFDSSAKTEGLSLNSVLLKGPDLANSLLGVLLRFRKGLVAVTADIQQMFYCFYVSDKHRNYLRFLWYQDNNFDKPLTEYRMRVHVFGNSPSPAVATFGLRHAANIGEDEFGSDVKEYIDRNFYVDDGLISLSNSDAAVDLIQRTQQALLKNGNLRLHKIASNSTQVMESFPPEDRAKDLKDLNLGTDDPPLQRSLGLAWDLKTDTFTFKVENLNKSSTRRSILSTINSLYDPLGFLSPVIIKGKVIFREILASSTDWDEPIPEIKLKDWETWQSSLINLDRLQIPRVYSTSLDTTVKREIHIYSDASEKAISAVAYLCTTDSNGHRQVGFIFGKSKVAPSHSNTIPRLELCAAVLAVEISDVLKDQMDMEINSIHYHTDSKVVLGYIYNETRRFYIYVGNRVDRIRRSSLPAQWTYIHTGLNPADQGTRSVAATEIANSIWLNGPPHLAYDNLTESSLESYTLENADSDSEVRPQVISIATRVTENNTIGLNRFDRFSSWKHLVRGLALLKHIARTYCGNTPCSGWHHCTSYKDIALYAEVEALIIQQVQLKHYGDDIASLKINKPLNKQSSLYNLDPYLDNDGLIRVGGRLSRAQLDVSAKHPVIIPGHSHIASLLISHYHDEVQHQGRHFTDGAIRAAGYWIIGSKRLVSSFIHSCVKCRRLRGKLEHQKMSDLPADRLTSSPPFSYVGVDTFGPWNVTVRRTRSHQADSKRWAVLFTCLTTRSIHIEVVEEISASAFINALKRFISIRGHVTEFRSDRGTNFVGAVHELGLETLLDENGPTKAYLDTKKTSWTFNPPHASHMGGVWERMIGIVRRILNSMLMDIKHKSLTHDVLITLMAEICAIVNGRPIVPVSTDPDQPIILSPSTLLTQKTNNNSSEQLDLVSTDMKDLYKSQWKCVRYLADTFWTRWRKEYLQTLQPRRKWQNPQNNLKPNDIVLLKDDSVCRNEWPTAVIERVFPGQDGHVRKVVLRVAKNGTVSSFTRPVTETVLLLSADH